MPNLKTLKRRISSIKSTKKITQAMKLVAASKVRKAQARVLSSRPYTEKLNSFTLRTVMALDGTEREEVPLMAKREVKTIGIIAITSDRGLCGSYNTNIIKKVVLRIQELKKANIEVKLIAIGSKGVNVFRRTGVEIIDRFTQIPAIPTIEIANLIAQSAEKAFLEKKVDAVEIIGTDFISMLRSEIYIKNFLPISENTQPINPELGGESFSKENNHQPSTINQQTVLFEPSLEKVLEVILPSYLSNMIFHGLFEASCSELASRMNAMSSATTNAKDLIDRLTIVYNKGRQAAITQELAEIAGGVEAMK